jgi:tetratricopeptide (TPR) repeat protein
MALAFVFAAQTAARNRDYDSDERIWMDTIAKQPSNARAHHNYAVDLARVGRMEAAEIQARAALAAKPDMAGAHQLLGVILGSTGRPQEGIAELQRARALDPTDPATYRDLGEAYGASGDLGSAVQAFLQAVHYQPDDPFLLNRAGWLLATAPDAHVRDGARALSLARHAVELTRRQDSVSLDTLAAAHAEVEEFDAAVTTAREALAVARKTGETAIVPELEQRRALYESRQPFRTPAK